MRIKKMRATFGTLEGRTLELAEGLNLLQAPNEGGKSTWSAFLRAMFYGIPTKERDRQGYIAEKNRYQPWSGAAMEGELELTWRGQEITLRRGPRGNTPFGAFEAVYTGTGEPVPGLTGENAGETLLGVPREVFERSAFVGQGGAALDGAPALEARIAQLASSGEEGVSYSQVERRLKDWRNRRQHNKTGLIPKLEGELAVLDDTLERQTKVHRALQQARQEADRLEEEGALLRREAQAHDAAQKAARVEKYRAARRELEQAEEQLEQLERETASLPPADKLRAAQGDLSYLNTLQANLKLAQSQAEQAAEKVRLAQEQAADPAFDGMDEEKARQSAQAHRAEMEGIWSAGKRQRLLSFALCGAAVALIVISFVNLNRFPFPVHAVLNGGAIAILVGGLIGIKRQTARMKTRWTQILEHYGVEGRDEIPDRAEEYCRKLALVRQAAQEAQAVEDARDRLSGQIAQLRQALLELVRPFAPQVSDLFGVSAALSRALGLEEKCTAARVRLEGAQKLARELHTQEESGEEAAVQPRFDPARTAALLHENQGELTRLRSAMAMAQGELNTLGDPALFRRRREELLEQLDSRRREYQALDLALEALEGANGMLQARFSPALNRRAGEIMERLTGGAYRQVALTRQFEALATPGEGVLPRRASALSQGTADQLYLAVRLAVCELALPQEESIPLVLDDALANFDDERMALALDFLLDLAGERQILLFTCHSREGERLAGRPGAAILPLQS